MAKNCFSQYGQDIFAESAMIARNIIPRDKNYSGVYIDVGCCWPINNNNTYYFYSRGWRGMCIDANPEMEDLFASNRPEDIFVNCGVANDASSMTYYMYNNRQHNSFHTGRAEKNAAKVIATKEIPIRRISSLIDEKLSGRQIDFLSMDIEGLEISALKSLDLDRHRPSFLCIECIEPIRRIHDNEIVVFLAAHDYDLIAHTGHDAYFVNKKLENR